MTTGVSYTDRWTTFRRKTTRRMDISSKNNFGAATCIKLTFTHCIKTEQFHVVYHELRWPSGKHPALGANGRRFEPSKSSKLFQRLISRLTTSWVVDHVKWRCRLHEIIKKIKGDVKHSGSDYTRGISAPSFRTAPL